MANVASAELSEQGNDRPTYRKYQELLYAQRAKTWRLFNGLTKAGRCEMVATEIFTRLGEEQYRSREEKELLIAVLHTEVLPKVDAQCQAQIRQRFAQVQDRCRKKILRQKYEDLEKILGRNLQEILCYAEGDERDNLIEQCHTLFVDKLRDCTEQERGLCGYQIVQTGKESLGFVSLLNRTDIPVVDACMHIQRLRSIIARAPGGMRGISALLDRVPAKATELIQILLLANEQVPDLLKIIEKVPDKNKKEILIHQLHILFVNKLQQCAMHIANCIATLQGMHGNEIANIVTLLSYSKFNKSLVISFIFKLREILRNNPDMTRQITEIFEMVPEKTEYLIEILQHPGAAGAVQNLLDILKIVPTGKRKEFLIDQMHTFFLAPWRVSVDLPSLNEYLACFQQIPEHERYDFIDIANDLLLLCQEGVYERFSDYFQCLKNCPAEERRGIADQVKRFLRQASDCECPCTPYAALACIRALPTAEKRDAFIEQIPALFREARSSMHRFDPPILLYLFLFSNEEERTLQARQLHLRIYGIDAQKQATLIVQAQRLYDRLRPLIDGPVDAVLLLQDKVPENERENFIAQIPSLIEEINRIHGLVNNGKLHVLLVVFQRVPSVERVDFIRHLCNLRLRDGQGYLDEQAHLESLVALPANERGARVEALNLQYELDNAPAGLGGLRQRRQYTLNVDPADFSDETRNPTRPLLQLFEEIDRRQQFPRFRYRGSEGIDAGGLTRNFVSEMFRTLCDPDQKRLPFMKDGDRYLPQVEAGSPQTLSVDDQIKCYKAIGMLFARAITGDPSLGRGDDCVTTGTHFHPVLFAMIHALTPDEMNRIPDLLVDDSVPEIKLKLIKLYLKTRYPELFQPKDIDAAVVDEEIDRLMRGEVSPRLQALGVGETFIKDYVHSIIQATLIIAKSMYKTSALSADRWRRIIGNAPEDLSKKIEGALTAELVIDAFGLRDEAEETRKGMVKRWIREASPEALKQFVYSISGSTTLAPGQKLQVQLCRSLPNPANAPMFHTCHQYMDLPDYETYEIFKEKLAMSIASAIVGGFSVA